MITNPITNPVVLKSGKEIEIRQLGMYELDNIPKNVPGPYTVMIFFGDGEVYKQPIDLTIERRKPDKPFEECKPGESDYYDWREYMRWQEGLLHAQDQYEAYCDYCERIAGYIRDNCILTEIDYNEIVIEDWPSIHKAALCPEVTMEDIAAAMRLNFPLPV